MLVIDDNLRHAISQDCKVIRSMYPNQASAIERMNDALARDRGNTRREISRGNASLSPGCNFTATAFRRPTTFYALSRCPEMTT